MKKGFTLKMPAFEFRAAPGDYNTGILVAKSWAGVPLRERDRDVLPVLHGRGYVNAANGIAPSTTPAPTFPVVNPSPPPFLLNLPAWVEAPRYWGKQGTLLGTPRSMHVDALKTLYGSAADGAALDAAGVFRYGPQVSEALYNGLFLLATPWQSRPVGSLGDGATGGLPVVDPTSFTAGDVLVIASANASYYNTVNYDGVSVAHSAQEGLLLANDLAQAAAALPRFNRLRFRVYSSFGRPGEAAFYGPVMAAAQAAGLDATFTAAAMTLASLRNDYKTFFGI